MGADKRTGLRRPSSGVADRAMAVVWSRVFDWDKEGWRDQAACRDEDPELFFPAGTTGAALDRIQAAKSVCRSCPVQRPCLQFALETNQDSGVWGGTDEQERRRLRSARPAGRRTGSVIT